MYLLVWLFSALFSTAEEGNTPLQLNISTSTPGRGAVHVAIFSSRQHFEARQQACYEKISPAAKNGSLRLSVPNLAAGQYAVAAFQDLNNNGKLDVNAMGIPQEPYAFSRNPRAKWKAPSYEEAVFNWPGAGAEQSIQLKHWSER